MGFSADLLAPAVLKASLGLAISALLVYGLIRLFRCSSAKLQQTAWFFVILQGLIWVHWPLDIPWDVPQSSSRQKQADSYTLPNGEDLDVPQKSMSVMHWLPGGVSWNASTDASSPQKSASEGKALSPFDFSNLWQWGLAIWGLGMLLCFAVASQRYGRFWRRLRTNACVTIEQEAWETPWHDLLNAHGVQRGIPFRVTHDVGPALCLLPTGYEVVVPRGIWSRLTEAQRYSILCHELAHYEQGDLWRSLLVRGLALPQWFNPLSWWAVRQYEECTEWLCDHAVTRTEASPLEYAQTLLCLGSPDVWKTSCVGAARGSRLFHRVRRLISNSSKEDSMMKKVALLSAVCGLLLIGVVQVHLVAKEPGTTDAVVQTATAKEDVAQKTAVTEPAKGNTPSPTAENQKTSSETTETEKTAIEKPSLALTDLSEFPDEPAARAMYMQALETIQEVETLSFRSHMTHVTMGIPETPCDYRVWLKKPNYCRIESEAHYDDSKIPESLRERGQQAVLVGDGEMFWTYWPKGRPFFDCEDANVYEKTYMNTYLKSPATSKDASIWLQMGQMGPGFPCIDLSLFHGHKALIQWRFDAVRSRGIEKVDNEECDVVEAVQFKEHRWTFWLSKNDHLPRKIEYFVCAHWRKDPLELSTTEQWFDIALNAEIPNDKFTWQPSEGWTEWQFPETHKHMLPIGTTVPDFKLTSADGKQIQLSDYRGKPVWLCFWAASHMPIANLNLKPGERPDLRMVQNIYAKFKDSGLVVLGYNATDEAKAALETIHANDITFPNILDASDQARAIRLDGYHCSGFWAISYIIDRDGKIAAAFWNSHEDDETFLAKVNATLQKVGGESGDAAKRSVDATVAQSAEEVAQAARQLFQAIRDADYNHDYWGKSQDWKRFPAKDIDYDVDRNAPEWVRSVCNKLKDNPIVDVQLGNVFANAEGQPTVHFRLQLKNNEILEGDMPFLRNYNPDYGPWTGQKGLDWHLQEKK